MAAAGLPDVDIHFSQIKTRSIEKTLLPLIKQISSLVATRGEAAAGGAAVQRVGAAVCCAVERFVAVGETIADDNPDVRHSMVLACKEARAAALPQQERIAGGTITSITQYPFSAAVLFAPNAITFRQDCGGTIVNNRTILTAAHCFIYRFINQLRARVGSPNAHSGGLVHTFAALIAHPNYNTWNQDNDIGLMRITSVFTFGPNVRSGSIAGPAYFLADNQFVWAIGWGVTFAGGTTSEQLRHVQLSIINQARCQSIYGAPFITPNMICAGWDAGGRGSCSADSGSPLLHNYVTVGVTSFGAGCGDGRFPGVYARVSRFTSFIQAYA